MRRLILTFALAALIAAVPVLSQTVDITVTLTSPQQTALEADRVARLGQDGQPVYKTVQEQAVFVCEDAIGSIEKRYASTRIEAIKTALMDADAAKLAAIEAELAK